VQEQVPILVKQNSIGGIICDFSPLRIHVGWVKELKKSLPANVPFAQVDAHNVVPCWHASDKVEVGARTIRSKINNKLSEFLTDFPPVVEQTTKAPALDLTSLVSFPDLHKIYDILECDKTVKPVTWATPGYTHGIKMLQSFIESRLKIYDTDRNDPNKTAQSNLSPWLHYGQISAQRACWEVKKYTSKAGEAVKSFLEETIVRRELADNYCFYQKNYDNLNGAAEWAKLSLEKHASDKRPHLYSLEQLDNGKTADQLWNASQIQLRVEGKMHGFLRMYWAKKVFLL
jgi:deoxyribodipyrimidine photo-lyase